MRIPTNDFPSDLPPPIRDIVEPACRQASAMRAQGAPLPEVLACLVDAAEQVSGEIASILVLDQDGLLRNGASPQLPPDYLAAIDRLRPRAGLGTCAAAAATGCVVLTPSFLADDKWAELRHLPLALGFAGAWSLPIKSARDGRVLGTFGTYFRTIREPALAEVAAVTALAAAAAAALEAQ